MPDILPQPGDGQNPIKTVWQVMSRLSGQIETTHPQRSQSMAKQTLAGRRQCRQRESVIRVERDRQKTARPRLLNVSLGGWRHDLTAH